MIDISERIKLFEILTKLQSEEKPEFGSMTPQHMVEHLTFSVKCSNGKEPQKHHFPKEIEEKIKGIFINTDNDIPIGFKSPILPKEGLPVLVHSNLRNAIDNLKIELDYFDEYFIKNPSEKPINPTMGELNYQEWLIFHNKHFAHHFRQFRLL